MAGRLQLRRGSTIQNDAFTGAMGEPTLDTETGIIRIHDGETQGGKEFIDPVVAFQVPTADNNYTWYRLHASGWVEQGGRVIDATQRTSSSIVLPIEMNDAYYTISATPLSTSTDLRAGHISTSSITTTGFTYGWLNGANAVTYDMCWEVKGMAAQGA